MVSYKMTNNGIAFMDQAPKGRPAKVEWKDVDVRGEVRRLIQNIYSADANIEQAI